MQLDDNNWVRFGEAGGRMVEQLRRVDQPAPALIAGAMPILKRADMWPSWRPLFVRWLKSPKIKASIWERAQERELSPTAHALALYCPTSPHAAGECRVRDPRCYQSRSLLGFAAGGMSDAPS
jgi:hypothetical protein